MEVRDVLLADLAELLEVELVLAGEVLPELLRQTNEEHFREALEEHIQQTRRHVANLERTFACLGEAPWRTESHGLAGLRRQHDELLRTVESAEVRDLVNAAAAARTEHYEIATYRSLITAATLLGEPDAVALLEQNLHDEEEALAKLEKSIPERLSTRLTAGSGALQ